MRSVFIIPPIEKIDRKGVAVIEVKIRRGESVDVSRRHSRNGAVHVDERSKTKLNTTISIDPAESSTKTVTKKVFEERVVRTNNNTKANPKQKTNGPARSASSMISGAGRRRGLRTVRDLARMCEGLIPISEGMAMG